MSQRQSGNDGALVAKHVAPDSIAFSVFNRAQLKRLCVVKILTPMGLDALGHPLNGGLYDRQMGTINEKSEPCGTCRKTHLFCPGHFGYVELPLPVVNPIFHKIVGLLLKISCLQCHQFQISAHIKYTLIIQIQLLNCGLVTEALELHREIQELIHQHKSLHQLPEETRQQLRKYEILAAETKKTLQAHAADQATWMNVNKHTEALRDQFINQTLVKDMKTRRVCMHCKSTIDRIQWVRNRIIMVSRSTDVALALGHAAGRIKSLKSKYMTPDESRTHLRQIWLEEKPFMQAIAPVLAVEHEQPEHPVDIFYMDLVPVIPSNMRPTNFANGRAVEHPRTAMYKSLVEKVMLLNLLISVMKNDCNTDTLSVESKGVYDYAFGKSAVEKLNNAWEALQYDVDALMDTSRIRNVPENSGLKQIIEKKAGIIRMNMMGKRVNYSARSVITPDPNLNIDEIGIPEEFAKRLTYPVPVTAWNVEYLRKLITNGPNVHPGALAVEYEDGFLKRITDETRQAILKQLLTPSTSKSGNAFRGVKRVHRHLCNGDVLLLNRQPTLHKPSIMAHTARILKGEKTLRLHYSNCKAYNADFDGDEMNAHFPQNELARSEAYNLVNVRHQYLVPKDGTPLGGLIQDHMIAGVKMSTRGRFFPQHDYQQLVFQCFSHKTGKIQLLPPAIMKPVALWSGKQILSTVIINIIPENSHRINLTAGAKIGPKAWQSGKERPWKAGGSAFRSPLEMSEAAVVIRQGELLQGVLDKMHYGATPYGLVHCMYELYGGSYATQLLSALTKLFTRFLQREGFTLGVRDILTVTAADRKRSDIVAESRKVGVVAVRQALGLADDTPVSQLVETIERTAVTDPKLRAVIDRSYKTVLDSFTNDINRTCLPAGLVTQFPHNNLQLMVQSGAKGSTVNTMQISCLLGQIELEGKRPPLMISGKSLPSFPLFEFAPRAGGFIDGRFMTGIQPQEFFFHCMAGREGLIDTAVKTSRSGYLQRCLVKHLEGLHVAYDLTVRDSDKTVVQFMYGEDGMDISKAQFLNAKQLAFLAENASHLDKQVLKTLKHCPDQDQVKQHEQSVRAWCQEYGDPLQKRRTSPFALFSTVVREKMNAEDFQPTQVVKMWRRANDSIRSTFIDRCVPCPAPTSALYQPDRHFGALNERLHALMNAHKLTKSAKHFKDTFRIKAMTSLCHPGEPVGLLAAQSIGEPSTQMTLNTFHFAGRGEMNVTLGIPRLREILMMASKNIKTPSMEVPFLAVPNVEASAEMLRKKLTRVVVGDVLEKIDVSLQLIIGASERCYQYTLKFHFLPQSAYEDRFYTTPRKIIKHMTKRFFKEMFAAITKYSKVTSNMVSMEDETKAKRKTQNGDEDEDEEDEDDPPRGPAANDDSSDEEPEDLEDAKSGNKFKQSHDDQEPEEEEREDSDSDDKPDVAKEEPDDNEADKDEASVLDQYKTAQGYQSDRKHHAWCQLTFALPLSYKKLDLNAILKDVAYKSVIWETPHIKRAITYMKDDRLTMRTDGINILAICKYHELLDLNRLYCNDIHKMAEMYGIEAARTVIVKEVKDVFNVYGIKVDPRHLSLISDYMTTSGEFAPMSRRGMESSASPLQQMSFEASLTFLKHSTIGAKTDPLQNPSSCLMVGKPNNMGTGSFQLFHKFPSSVN